MPRSSTHQERYDALREQFTEADHALRRRVWIALPRGIRQDYGHIYSRYEDDWLHFTADTTAGHMALLRKEAEAAIEEFVRRPYVRIALAARRLWERVLRACDRAMEL